MRRIAVLFAAAAIAGCGFARTYQNADARVVAQYNDITAASDLAAYLVRTGTLKPDTAQIVHDTLAVAKGHVDEAKAIVQRARAEGRTATREEVLAAWGALDLAADALRLILPHLEKKGQ